MIYGRVTTRNLSEAIKLGNRDLHPDADGVEVAYDKHDRIWNAWYTQLHQQKSIQVGYIGRGSDPLAAVQDMIERNDV